jgi:hypothetical protein
MLEHAWYATPQYTSLHECGAIERKEPYTLGNEIVTVLRCIVIQWTTQPVAIDGIALALRPAPVKHSSHPLRAVVWSAQVVNLWYACPLKRFPSGGAGAWRVGHCRIVEGLQI